MIDRRRMNALLALGLAAGPVAAQRGDAAQVPPLSGAPLGDKLAPGWRHQRLPKVERANAYAIVDDDGGRSVLRVTSSSSASSWVCSLDVDPARTPFLHWRWKVSRSLPGSDVRIKGGDDYAARLYVFFDLPTERLSLTDRLRIQAARTLSGTDIPAASLCYVWGRAQPTGATAWNPYTDRVRMVVVDSGDEQAGRWREHSRDVRRDWAEAFGGAVPRIAGIGVGADTDNTKSQVEAWFDDPRFDAQA